MNKILMILSILMLSSCSTKEQHTSGKDTSGISHTDSTRKIDGGKQTSTYQLSPNQVVIKLNDDDFNKLIGKNNRSWTPDENNIGSAEKLIQQCFDDQKRGTVNYLLERTPGEYNHQFVGYLAPNGDKMIWVNCFKRPKEDYPEWKHQIIIAEGGGNNFFNLKVNLSQSTYTNLKINGK